MGLLITNNKSHFIDLVEVNTQYLYIENKFYDILNQDIFFQLKTLELNKRLKYRAKENNKENNK